MMSQAPSEEQANELLLRLRPVQGSNPMEKNQLRDCLRLLARKFGWDLAKVAADEEVATPESTEP